ncbi:MULTISPECIES: IclR family transcriptional regulator [Polymorphospora]|uniref:IclR family transcriptional regulator n=1 Tax=Polymorphospora lycopeni TaxID=3140240 RepID=A0ABV5D1Z7_9ACTN
MATQQGAAAAAHTTAMSQSIQRALDVLETLSTEAPEVGQTLTELADRLGLPKSTVARVLFNLESRGFVEQDGLRRYRVGMRLFSIGGQALANSHLRVTSRPYLEDLTLRVGESSYLGVLDMQQVLYVDRIESPQPVKLLSPIGSHRPVNATAMGKALVAWMDETDVRRLLKRTGMASRTRHTVTELDAFVEGLERIRADGVAVDVGEWDEGLTCVAAPVRSSNGAVVGALGISGPSWRLSGEQLKDATRLLAKAVADLGTELAPTVR